MAFNFREEDLAQFAALGIKKEMVEDQLIRIKQGYPRTQVTSVVLAGAGIRQLSDEELDRYIAAYEEFNGTAVKFIPASGAATRMFKRQYEYLQGERSSEDESDSPFDESIELYPFYEELRDNLMIRGKKIAIMENHGEYDEILHVLLDESGMNYGQLPKALIPFHKNEKGEVRKAFEEHMVEAALYTKKLNGSYHLHFTVDRKHHNNFRLAFRKAQLKLEQKCKASFELHLTEQLPSTNTIAANLDGTPFRQSDGSLLFRPAGHGALLTNLQAIDSDIIFIKNIDNVAPDRLKSATVRYKKALAGVLLEIRDQVYSYLRLLEDSTLDENTCNEILNFCRKELSYRLPVGIKEAPLASRLRFLRMKLNRPIRVCGVVRNEGEPGGGPFWVRERDGSESLQIVETSQMELTGPRVQELLEKAKYFNPVDILCCTKDYKGKPFKLEKYVNKHTGFISQKSVNGTPILALELPGLWNGAMAEWNTVFVEVPAITFTPVKELTDLLRPEHLVRAE